MQNTVNSWIKKKRARTFGQLENRSFTETFLATILSFIYIFFLLTTKKNLFGEKERTANLEPADVATYTQVPLTCVHSFKFYRVTSHPEKARVFMDYQFNN